MKGYLKQISGEPRLILDYIVGNYRWYMYKYHIPVLRKHIVEQFESRIIKAYKCYKNKSCYGCGCATPQLFFANKGCSAEKLSSAERVFLTGEDKICYTKMKNKKEWKQK